jgi:signal transduction histidine kinase
VEILATLDEVPNVRGTSAGMHDVLINVLLNAVDAMPEGGTIRLSTKETPDAVQLSVRDNGAGMDEETRSKIFEPFFTTKAQVGTGLGLSTVYGAVTRWGGNIDVWSSPGRGTTVTLFFKKCASCAKSAGPQPKKTEAIS